ncbi:helix-turn-helix domain-containing protein [Epibacterium ulvae]|uniref:Helix-turn-helix n=1 Tax=Epibacterium ulvae TaxID=1156985 RepID=A0A1G5PZF5_9RHOB|nr:helix-turn-helix domain-containing protein [Epibacterium ulvae]SCZ54541.1 Helix-turn-helix [Epibacterium ulvae]
MSETEIDWYGPDTATLGDRILAAREAAGMTQAQLARRIGIKKTTLVGWEADLSEPRANRMSMMAGVLNVSIMWLMTGEGDGMDAPQANTAPENLSEVLRELRLLRGEIRASSDRAARLEKRLVALMNEPVT